MLKLENIKFSGKQIFMLSKKNCFVQKFNQNVGIERRWIGFKVFEYKTSRLIRI